jgi:hypothetical protein
MDIKTNETLLTCQGCGVVDATVTETVDPYALEIHEEEIECTLCDKCYHEAGQEI